MNDCGGLRGDSVSDAKEIVSEQRYRLLKMKKNYPGKRFVFAKI